MSEEFDLSQAVEKVQQMLSSEEGEAQIQNLLGMLTGGAEDAAEPKQESTSGIGDMLSGMPDLETLMKMKNIMSLLGNQKNDTNTAFLNSLKPFLKKDRRQKLEQATKLMSVAKAIKLFKDSGIGGI